MDARHAVRRGVGSPLDQVLLNGLASPLGVGMEGHQPFGFVAVAQTVVDDGVDRRPVVGPGRKHRLQFGPEGKTFDVLEQRVDARTPLALVHEGEELLEHARGGSRRRNELHDIEPCGGLLVACRRGVGRCRVKHHDAVARRGGPHHVQPRKTAAKILQLRFDPGRGQPVVGNLL